jgi:uncharacterized protein
MNYFQKLLLTVVGFIFVALGIIGIFTPVMPSIPFFIIASICFSKSSQKFHRMLMDNKWVGPHIKNYHENNGVSLKVKILMLVAQWGGLGITSVLFVHNLIGRIIMVIIGVGATVYILSLKTAKE